MDYRSAYQSLSELFPQVDTRILKAVAIEHRNDMDAAVEFILSDVLRSSPTHVSHEIINDDQLREQGGAEILPTDMTSSAKENVIDLVDSICEMSEDKNSIVGESEDHSGNTIDLVQSLGDKNSIVGESEDHSGNTIDLVQSLGELSKDRNSVVSDSEDHSESIIDLVHSVTELSKDGTSVLGESEVHLQNLEKKHPELLAYDTEVVSIEEDVIPLVRSRRSCNSINIDILEDCITDAKSNKKALVSAVESLVDLTGEAEILEERAKQAKEEASSAGEDILVQVEALKQMLQHAKQANDMHAGEVYGEKAILLTEARELQSRLLNLSDERNRSLAIVKEIRETLEARVAAAKDELAAAEQEKLEKEGQAKKALKEQEALMEIIAQESKKLQEEAEENAKLRDFLVDRGRLVDTLQGEIAVICEDVMMLKRRVYERAPLKGSLLVRTYSSASSSSSYGQKSIHSADGHHEHAPLRGSLLTRANSLASSSSSYGHKSIHSADGLISTASQGENTGEHAEDPQSAVQEKVITVSISELPTSSSEQADTSCKERGTADDDWELLKPDASPF